MAKPSSCLAFTLVELMISIAIVVVLMIGITKVFSLTSNTAGATNTIGAAIRDGRAAQTMFYNDLGNAASDMPFMILRSAPQPAFRNKTDKLADRDYNSGAATAAQYLQMYTVDLTGNNQETQVYNSTSVSNRNHRVDVFSFFAHGLYPRQTGNSPDTYLADMSSPDAWIWYGHLRLANNNSSTPTYFDPGDTTTGNDNNFYASDWVLGRQVILLASPTSNQIRDRQGNLQGYISQTGTFGYGGSTFTVNNGNVTPFSYLSPATFNTDSTTITMQSSRYDLAGTSMGTISQQLSAYLTWLAGKDPTHTSTWWTPMMTGDPIATGNSFPTARFQAKTFAPQPMQSADLALTSPLFVQHCSQFIVEYAGDYLNQDPTTGAILGVYSATSYGTDGYTDFYIDANGNRQIRWYGFPRDTLGTGAGVASANGDVVPLRDLWIQASTYTDANNPSHAPFEKVLYEMPAPSNYSSALSNPTTPMPYYECVWGPSDPKPKMIRITMTIDDPSGKLPDGQTFQYVIKLR